MPNLTIVGFTGTQSGMTAQQSETVRRLLTDLHPRNPERIPDVICVYPNGELTV